MAYNVLVRAFILDDDLQQIFTDEDSFEIVVPYLDTDGDGIADDFDAFPGDPSETMILMEMVLGITQMFSQMTHHFGRKSMTKTGI